MESLDFNQIKMDTETEAVGYCRIPKGSPSARFLTECDQNLQANFVRIPHIRATKKAHRFGVLYGWRRMRDSNPRAFWANGFQDRLVVTASIILRKL